jgi:hypothetical protein
MGTVQSSRRRCAPERALIRVASLTALTDLVECGDPALEAWVRRHTLGLCFPLVYERHTRALEFRRGHGRCASGIARLDPDCHDGFTDDVLAVVGYVLRYARFPIANLPGWITSRLTKATVDGYRQRRGELGALQRPRLPQWLATALADDPWLCRLSLLIMEWVGVSATAGGSTWPIDQWTLERCLSCQTHGLPVPHHPVDVDIRRVVAVMVERRPGWYERYVETPLARKQTPVSRVPIELATPLPLADPDPDPQLDLSPAISQACHALRQGDATDRVVEHALTVIIDLAGPLDLRHRLRDEDVRRRVGEVLLDIAV